MDVVNPRYHDIFFVGKTFIPDDIYLLLTIRGDFFFLKQKLNEGKTSQIIIIMKCTPIFESVICSKIFSIVNVN